MINNLKFSILYRFFKNHATVMNIKRVLKFFNKQWLFIFVVFLLFFVLFAYLKLLHLQKNSSAESYTELYFPTLQQLPQQVPAKPLTVQFAIRNEEKKTINYTYVVLIKTNDTTHLLRFGTSEIVNNQTKLVTVVITPTKIMRYKEVIVYLVNKNQEIHLYFPDS